MYLGEFYTLYALRKASCGIFLWETGSDRDVLLPNKYVPVGLKLDDTVDVFLYRDSEDRIVATTITPKILLHQFATLEVKEVTTIGAFLDWGLEKDLFLPFVEQVTRVKKGDKVTVFLYLDERTDRLVASANVRDFAEENTTLKEGEEVDLLVDQESDLGFQVIINNKYRTINILS